MEAIGKENPVSAEQQVVPHGVGLQHNVVYNPARDAFASPEELDEG